MQVGVDGLTFEVEVRGEQDGAPVLLLHGFPQSRRAWEGIVPSLTSAGLRTIAPDQRGYSPGARPTGADAYRLPLLAGDALGILDALRVESAHVVGHDWGSVVAWYLAARHPQRVRSLTAISFPHLDAFWAGLRADPEQRALSRYLAFFMSPESTPALLAEGAEGLRSLFGSAVKPELVDHYLALHGTAAVLDATMNWYRSGSLLDDHEPLGPVRVPTTCVSSDGDRAASAGTLRRTEDHVLAPYRFTVLSGVSHWQPEEAPEQVAAEVLARVRS